MTDRRYATAVICMFWRWVLIVELEWRPVIFAGRKHDPDLPLAGIAIRRAWV